MLVTTLGYLSKDNQILMLHRTSKQNDINHDKWIGIGGKLEDSESVLGCIQRECKEETGLTWTNPTLKAVITFNFRKHPEDPLFSELMFLYCGGQWHGEMKDCDEGELVWIDQDQISSLNLWQGDRIFMYYMNQDLPLFYMELNYLGDTLISATFNEQPVDLHDSRWSN